MCNVFGDATPPKHLFPHFRGAWNGDVHDVERGLADRQKGHGTSRKVMARRKQTMSSASAEG